MTHEQHLYLKLIEECAEVQQMTAKLMQFEANEKQETTPLSVRGGTPVPDSNREKLEEEVMHLLAIVNMLGLGA